MTAGASPTLAALGGAKKNPLRMEMKTGEVNLENNEDALSEEFDDSNL